MKTQIQIRERAYPRAPQNPRLLLSPTPNLLSPKSNRPQIHLNGLIDLSIATCYPIRKPRSANSNKIAFVWPFSNDFRFVSVLSEPSGDGGGKASSCKGFPVIWGQFKRRLTSAWMCWCVWRCFLWVVLGLLWMLSSRLALSGAALHFRTSLPQNLCSSLLDQQLTKMGALHAMPRPINRNVKICPIPDWCIFKHQSFVENPDSLVGWLGPYFVIIDVSLWEKVCGIDNQESEKT